MKKFHLSSKRLLLKLLMLSPSYLAPSAVAILELVLSLSPTINPTIIHVSCEGSHEPRCEANCGLILSHWPGFEFSESLSRPTIMWDVEVR